MATDTTIVGGIGMDIRTNIRLYREVGCSTAAQR
jgi:hypothetical protein